MEMLPSLRRCFSCLSTMCVHSIARFAGSRSEEFPPVKNAALGTRSESQSSYVRCPCMLTLLSLFSVQTPRGSLSLFSFLSRPRRMSSKKLSRSSFSPRLTCSRSILAKAAGLSDGGGEPNLGKDITGRQNSNKVSTPHTCVRSLGSDIRDGRGNFPLRSLRSEAKGPVKVSFFQIDLCKALKLAEILTIENRIYHVKCTLCVLTHGCSLLSTKCPNITSNITTCSSNNGVLSLR